MKNFFKLIGIIALVAVIGFSMAACGGGDDDPNPNPNPNPNPGDAGFAMQFTENTGWNQTGNEEWVRWHYKYQGDNTKTLDSNKAYILTCSFTSNVDIDKLGVQFIKEADWVNVSGWTDIHIPGTIPKNIKYNFKIPLFPNSNASDFLYIGIGNRDNSTAPTLTFSQFSLEPVNKEAAGLNKWTVSGKDINVTDTKRTFAKTETFDGKSTFHIKPTYNASTYDHFVMDYDLSSYAGKKIGVEMSFDAYINKPARVAWQMLIAPVYPLVCGYTDSDYFLSANTWHTISGNAIVDVPSSGDKKLYLSGMQINGAEAYFANATLTITEGSSGADTAVTLNSITADGSASSKTTQLTLTFSQAIPGLNAANITLGSSISGLTKGTLSGSGPTYTLPVTGFTTGGTLSVSVTKLGYDISGGPKTVTIYGGSGSGGGGDVDGTFNSLDDFKNWLNGKGNNNKGNPYNVKLNLSDLSGLADFLKGLSGKYVNLDFSGSGLTSIPYAAFLGCTNLTGITIPNTVISIGGNAFGNTSLTSITIPASVTSIGGLAFGGCANLIAINVDAGNTVYSSENGVLYNKNKSTLIAYPAGKTGSSFSIPSSVTSIEGNAFYQCTSLTSIIIPSSVTSIGAHTFDGCTGLTSITIPAGVTSIEFWTFHSCTNLTSVTFNGTITSANFNSYAFSGMGDLRAKFYATDTTNGTPGTYTTTAPVSDSSVWTKSTSGGGGSSGNPTVWTPVNSSTFTSGFSSVAWGGTAGNEKFVTVGGISGSIVYSSDGITWQSVTNSTFTNMNSVVWCKNKFVATGPGGKIVYSQDGLNWTAVSNSPLNTQGYNYNIAYDGNNKFVIVGYPSEIAYSSDGMSWTKVTNTTFTSSSYIYGATYGNGKFVAVGGDGQMAYSTDGGASWTKVTNSTFGTSSVIAIAYGNNKFVAVGSNGKMATSQDGINWSTVANSTFGSNNIHSITYDGNKFVAGGDWGKMAFSSDGTNWTAVTDSTFDNSEGNRIYGIAWGSNKLVAVGWRKEGSNTRGKIAYWSDN